MSEFDDTLTQLFTAARESLPGEDFLQSVTTRVTHARRRRAIVRAVLTLAAAGIAVAATPYVAAGSLAAAGRLGEWLPTLADALASPIVWVCSLAATAWGLRRAGRAS
jgi:cytochrome bd-type quinol oxidase subunit 2